MVDEGRLRELATAEGIDVFGVADVSSLWEGQIHLEPREGLRHLIHGVVMGHRLSQAVLQSIVDRPTLVYKHHYQRVNLLLDRAALMVARAIQSQGYDALPIAASQLTDWDNLLAHVSHRAVGALAGLGWIGRSTLLVHPQFGAQVRYVTVLTDMPLEHGDSPEMECRVKSADSRDARPQLETQNSKLGTRFVMGCGDCRKCIEVCPAAAIREAKEDFQVQRCHEKLKQFSKAKGIGVYICGLCVRVCDGIRTGLTPSTSVDSGQ